MTCEIILMFSTHVSHIWFFSQQIEIFTLALNIFRNIVEFFSLHNICIECYRWGFISYWNDIKWFFASVIQHMNQSKKYFPEFHFNLKMIRDKINVSIEKIHMGNFQNNTNATVNDIQFRIEFKSFDQNFFVTNSVKKIIVENRRETICYFFLTQWIKFEKKKKTIIIVCCKLCHIFINLHKVCIYVWFSESLLLELSID